jgi:hypothetical protein
LLITGMHLEFPGFGYLTRGTNRFYYEPEPWSPVSCRIRPICNVADDRRHVELMPGSAVGASSK